MVERATDPSGWSQLGLPRLPLCHADYSRRCGSGQRPSQLRDRMDRRSWDLVGRDVMRGDDRARYGAYRLEALDSQQKAIVHELAGCFGGQWAACLGGRCRQVEAEPTHGDDADCHAGLPFAGLVHYRQRFADSDPDWWGNCPYRYHCQRVDSSRF